MGITELVDPPEGGVRAGIMYLDRQIKRMDPTIPFGQRVRFALGRFSCVSGEEGCIGPPVSVCAEVP